MGLSNLADASYFGHQSKDIHVATFTNDEAYDIIVTSAYIDLGTGSGTFTAGDHVVGSGNALDKFLYVGSNSCECVIDNVCQAGYWSGGSWHTDGGQPQYPNWSSMVNYSFTFDGPILAPGESVDIVFDDNENGQCLCLESDTLEVNYQPASVHVHFDYNGGYRTGGGEPDQDVEIGGSAEPPTLEREGYDFAGWDGDYTNVDSDRTITAMWDIKTWPILYDANGGSSCPDSQTKIYGEDLTLAGSIAKTCTITLNPNGGQVTPTTHSRSFTFNGWKATNQVIYAGGGTYTANEGTTLTAVWGNPKVGELPVPTRTDYIFGGWLDPSNQKVTKDTTISGDIVLHARWVTSPVRILKNGKWVPYVANATAEDVNCVWKLVGGRWVKQAKIYKLVGGKWVLLEGSEIN